MERLRGAVAAVVCFATVTATLLSWQSFTTDPRHYLVPGLVIGGLVLVAGVAVRWARMPGAVVALVQLAVGLLATSAYLSGTPIPVTAAARARLDQAFTDCGNVLAHNLPPMPVQHGLAPMLLPGALLAYWVADVLACTLRRPSLAGLVLLGVFTVPFSVVGGGVRWFVFVLAAVGFLALLAVQESDRVGRWGRRLGDDTPGAVNGITDQGRAGAPVLIGAAATALAVAVPSFLPTMSIDVSSWGGGGNHSHDPIVVTNPMVGMYGSLHQQPNQPLVQVAVTSGVPQQPAYLRIAVLTKFNGTEWSTGDRSIPTDHTSEQAIDLPAGVQVGDATSYRITALPSFKSSWLPTFDVTTRISAAGDWRFDTDTYDFIAADPSLTTAGLTYADTAAPLAPSKQALERAPSGAAGVPSTYTELPTGFPTQVTQLAESLTADQPTPFQQAVALQNWFAKSGGFRYSLERSGGDSSDDLLHFVTDNKVGYCQQFATAMAAMARAIGIPARVAVGFLHSTPTPDGSYVFRGQDMHAWPELWFQGVGWVRFEPTPGVGASLPAYTQGVRLAGAGAGIDPGDTPTKAPPGEKGPGIHGKKPDQGARPATTPVRQPVSHPDRRSWAWAWVCLGILVAAALLASPWWLRRRRRLRRLAGGVEDAWAELRDTASDLGLPWAEGASPREQGSRLGRYVGTGEAYEALGRIVLAVERTRYARTPGSSATARDTAVVLAALEERTDAPTMRRARVLPRSLFSARPTGEGRGRAAAERESERRLVDRVG